MRLRKAAAATTAGFGPIGMSPGLTSPAGGRGVEVGCARATHSEQGGERVENTQAGCARDHRNVLRPAEDARGGADLKLHEGQWVGQ